MRPSRVFVCARIRPALSEEEDREICTTLFNDSTTTLVVRERHNQEKQYTFHRVFGPQHSQRDVFNAFGKNMVKLATSGKRAAIMAYGQTNSGKTYTLANRDEEQEGLLQQCSRYVFERIEDGKEGDGTNYTVEMSYTQIYNEIVSDLLSNDVQTSLTIRENPNHGVFIMGVTRFPVKNYGEIMNHIENGNRMRAVALTNMNAESSRSHVIMTLHIHKRDHAQATEGQLMLVDLAGSERLKRSKVQGLRKQEAQCINASLACLGNVVHALVAGRSHVPYRDCKLTRLLQDTFRFGHTSLVVTIGPCDIDIGETNSTLQFGMRAMKIPSTIVSNMQILTRPGNSALSSLTSTPTRAVNRNHSATPGTRWNRNNDESQTDTSMYITPRGHNSSNSFLRVHPVSKQRDFSKEDTQEPQDCALLDQLQEENAFVETLGEALREADDEIRELHVSLENKESECKRLSAALQAAQHENALQKEIIRQLLSDRERDRREFEATLQAKQDTGKRGSQPRARPRSIRKHPVDGIEGCVPHALDRVPTPPGSLYASTRPQEVLTIDRCNEKSIQHVYSVPNSFQSESNTPSTMSLLGLSEPYAAPRCFSAGTSHPDPLSMGAHHRHPGEASAMSVHELSSINEEESEDLRTGTFNRMASTSENGPCGRSREEGNHDVNYHTSRDLLPRAQESTRNIYMLPDHRFPLQTLTQSNGPSLFMLHNSTQDKSKQIRRNLEHRSGAVKSQEVTDRNSIFTHDAAQYVDF